MKLGIAAYRDLLKRYEVSSCDSAVRGSPGAERAVASTTSD